jgi:hypothetical protein
MGSRAAWRSSHGVSCLAEEVYSLPLNGAANHIPGFTRFVVALLDAQVPYQADLCAARGCENVWLGSEF